MDQNVWDVVVIGAGPGGYVAAIRAAQLGLKTAIIEREHLGGVCLNWGCIPTKSLLQSAEVLHTVRHSYDFGVHADTVSYDLPHMVKRSRAVSAKLSSGIAHLLKKNKITHIPGHGRILGQQAQTPTKFKVKGGDVAPYKINVTHDDKDTLIQARHVVIATGARARVLPGMDLKNLPDYVWTAREAMTPEKAPKSIIIIGSGAIGIEFASFYRTLGVDVSVVEMSDRIVPVEDKDVSKHAQKAFEAQGIRFYTSHALQSIDEAKHGGQVIIKSLNDEKEIKLTAEKILLAIGIVPNTDNLGLETTSIQTEKGHIVVDAYCETASLGIFAIGDVIHGPWLAHKASHEGIMVAEKIAGKTVKPIDKMAIPGCTYSAPQIASIGLREDEARDYAEKNDDSIKVGVFSFVGNGKALAMGADDGFVKLIFAKKTGEFLGAHMIGDGVSELIHSLALCKTVEATEESIMHTIFPHPTLSEMIHEAALASEKRAIHM